MKTAFGTLGLLAAFLLAGCTEPRAAVAVVGNPVILDVRTPEEFAEDHVPGAVNVPIDDLEQRITKVIKDKAQPLAVHCQAGGRSSRAKKKLEAMGYSKVTNWGSLDEAKKHAQEINSRTRG